MHGIGWQPPIGQYTASGPRHRGTGYTLRRKSIVGMRWSEIQSVLLLLHRTATTSYATGKVFFFLKSSQSQRKYRAMEVDRVVQRRNLEAARTGIEERPRACEHLLECRTVDRSRKRVGDGAPRGSHAPRSSVTHGHSHRRVSRHSGAGKRGGGTHLGSKSPTP